jgi:hypothetical protein
LRRLVLSPPPSSCSVTGGVVSQCLPFTASSHSIGLHCDCLNDAHTTKTKSRRH